MNVINLTGFPKLNLDDESSDEWDSDSAGLGNFIDISSNFVLQTQEFYDKYFEEWFEKIDGDFKKHAYDFVKAVIDDKSLSSHFSSQRIHQCCFELRFNEDDHLLIIDSIEEHLKSKFDSLHLVRLRSDVSRGKDLNNLLDELNTHQHVLVVVDQTETLVSTNLLRKLVNLLYDSLKEEENERRVMVIFCISSSSLDIHQLLNIECKRLMKIYEPVHGLAVRDTSISIANRLMKDASKYCLGPNVILYMSEQYSNFDGSFSNLRYVHRQATTIHLSRPEALALLPEKEFVTAIKKSDYLINSLSKLKSLKDTKQIDWSNPTTIAKSCTLLVKRLQKYRQYMLNQLECFMELIRDPSRLYFPNTLLDLYEEAFYNANLSDSKDFVDAVCRLRELKVEVIIQRMNKVLGVETIFSGKIDHDLRKITKSYLEKLNNNDNAKDIMREFISELLKHGHRLISIRNLPLHESYVFDDLETLKLRTTFATRSAVFKDDGLNDASSILLRLVLQSPEQINSKDLFGEFSEEMRKKWVCNPTIPTQSSSEVNVKRKLRKSSVNSKVEVTDSVKTQLDDAKLKVIFIDTLEGFELQGILKIDRRRTRRGILVRCLWP